MQEDKCDVSRSSIWTTSDFTRRWRGEVRNSMMANELQSTRKRCCCRALNVAARSRGLPGGGWIGVLMPTPPLLEGVPNIHEFTRTFSPPFTDFKMAVLEMAIRFLFHTQPCIDTPTIVCLLDSAHCLHHFSQQILPPKFQNGNSDYGIRCFRLANRPFLAFDFLSARVPESQKLKAVG